MQVNTKKKPVCTDSITDMETDDIESSEEIATINQTTHPKHNVCCRGQEDVPNRN